MNFYEFLAYAASSCVNADHGPACTCGESWPCPVHGEAPGRFRLLGDIRDESEVADGEAD